MKQFFRVSLVLVLCHVAVHAQIPNNSFESWTDGQPDGWLTNNVPGFAVPVTQSTTARSGSFALAATVVEFFGAPWPPLVQSQFPVSQRFATLSGYYQFAPVGGDSLIVVALMYSNAAMTYVAGGVFVGSSTVASYQQFSAPLEYVNSDVPDSCYIQIFISGEDTIHTGSTALIDDLSLSGTATGVEGQRGTPVAYSLEQNYPNPFNPSTTIRYGLQAPSQVRLQVLDLLGREVALLVDQRQDAGYHQVTFDARGLASGVYLYRIQAGDFVQTKKLLLLR